MAMLGYLRGISTAQICSFLHIPTRTLFKWWKLFREGGAKLLFTRRPRSDIKANNDALKQAVFALLHSPPASHGFNRTTWRMADLSRPCFPKMATVLLARRLSAQSSKKPAGKWRHARVVLTSNDPEYRAKVEAIKEILAELREDEAFFSIDEYGPFAIKQKGGVKQVPPGEQYVVSQWQRVEGVADSHCRS